MREEFSNAIFGEYSSKIHIIEGSIKKILEHLKNGGDLDMYIPNQLEENASMEIEDNDLNLARESIQSFRQKKDQIGTEEIISLLKHIEFDDTDETEE